MSKLILSSFPKVPLKRYTTYQQAITISLFSLKRRLILYLLLTVSFSSFSQISDSLQFIQYSFDNGVISSEGYLREGKPDAYWKSYYRTGVLKSEGNRLHFQLDGPWKFYNEEGQITSVIPYKHGLKEGLREYWLKDSTLFKTETYVSDQLQGVVTFYFSDRSVRKYVPFIDNREEGIGYEFDSLGVVISIQTYKKGVLTINQPINRRDRFNLRQRTWMEFYRNMSVKVDGTYKDDLKHGFWKYYKKDGDLIRIEKWEMGVLIEDGEQPTKMELVRTVDPSTGRISSIGGYVEGEKNGVHRNFDADGNITSAEIWNRDILLAEGLYDNQGRKQGIWKYYWQDGTLKATGKYSNDRKDGQWKYYFENGHLEQIGVYIFDQMDGVWNWYFDNDSLRLRQEFLEGLAHGSVIEYNDSNEIIVEGQFLDGMKTGTWKYTSHGVLETGDFVQDERTGEWIIKWLDTNQLRQIGSWKNGLREGIHIWYYKNGVIARRGAFVNDLKEGVWEEFAINGARYVTITYEAGVEVKYNRKELVN